MTLDAINKSDFEICETQSTYGYTLEDQHYASILHLIYRPMPS